MDLVTGRVAERQAYLLIQQRMDREVRAPVGQAWLTNDPPTLYSSRLCDASEFQMPEIRERLHALNYDAHDIHRKHWEKAAIALLVERFGYFDEQSSGLGLGVAAENLLYLFSNHCRRVVGIDLYSPTFRDGTRLSCEDVYRAAPFDYRRDRLEIAAMDMRFLDFPDSSFDFVWSVSSVEHVGSVDEIIATWRQIERVLKPGGHAFISSEWNRLSRNPVYQPGAILFDETLYVYLVSKLHRLKPLGPLHLCQSHHEDHVFVDEWATASGLEIRPCINLFWAGTFITPVLFVLARSSHD